MQAPLSCRREHVRFRQTYSDAERFISKEVARIAPTLHIGP